MNRKYLIVSLLIFISVLSCNFLEDAANNAGLTGNTTLDLPISYNLSSVSRTLATDYGITVSSVTVTVENDLFTYGPDVLTFDADTDIASGTIQDIVEGTYTVTLSAYMLDNDSNPVLVAEGVQSDVAIVSDQITNVDISMSIVVGLGDLVVNGTISNGSKIYFISDESGKNNIWYGDFDGVSIVNKTQLTFKTDGTIYSFSVSETLGKILYSFKPDEVSLTQCDLIIINLDGSEEFSIPNLPAEKAGTPITWSPDGSKIAFSTGQVSSGNHFLQVATIEPDGSNLSILFDTTTPRGSATHKTSLNWDANGLLFSDTLQWSDYAGKHEIYIYDNEGDFANLTNTSSEGESNPIYSPDKSQIAIRLVNNGVAGLGILNLSDSSQTVLIEKASGRNASPGYWTSDDKIVYHFKESDTLNDIYIMNSDGSNIVNLTDSSTFNEFSAYIIE